MKNTILSIVFAVLILVGSAYAAVIVNPTSTLVFSTKSNSFLSRSTPVTSDGSFKLNSTINGLSVSLGNTQVVLDADNKVNITSSTMSSSSGTLLTPSVPFSVSDLRVNTNNIESGIYTGTIQVVNFSDPAKKVVASVPVQVLIPAIQISTITIEDLATNSTDSTLEKGQKFRVNVDFKNIADRTDLQNVNIQVGVYKGEEPTDLTKLGSLVTNIDGDDLQDNVDSGDLSNGRSDSVSFDFTMPYDISDKEKFTVLAEATADSQDTSASFYAAKTKQFSVSVPNDKIRITKASLVPSDLVCGSNRVRLSAEIQNIGDSREDVQLFLRNSATNFEKILNNGDDLKLDSKFTNIDDFTKTDQEYVALTDVKPGQNVYTLFAYYNSGSNVEQKDIQVTLESCQKNTTTTSTKTGGDVVVVNPTNIPTQTIPNVPTSTLPTQPVSNPSYVTLKDVSGFSLGSDWVVPTVIGVGGLIVGIVVALLVIPRG